MDLADSADEHVDHLDDLTPDRVPSRPSCADLRAKGVSLRAAVAIRCGPAFIRLLPRTTYDVEPQPPTPPKRRSPPRPPSATSFAFTKLIVHDLEKMAAFYREVYGLHAVNRVRGESIGGEEIDEIMLSRRSERAVGLARAARSTSAAGRRRTAR